MSDVLVIVDVQRGFVNEHTRRIVPLIERAQADFSRVIATRYYRRPQSLINKLLSIEGFARGSADTELAFTPLDGVTVIEKPSYSCVDDSLVERLRGEGVDTAHICGIDTDQCVLMTAGDFIQNDIRPIVYANLTASAAGTEYHESGLLLLRRLIGNEQVRDYAFAR